MKGTVYDQNKYYDHCDFYFFLSINNGNANSLSSININANSLENGTMHIKKNWSMKTNKDTEIYKEEYNLDNMSITNFSISNEKGKYTLQESWNIDASFNSKKTKYGINNVSDGSRDVKSGEYGVLLVKFPLNTFNVLESNIYSKYPNFDSVLTIGEEGLFTYN